MSGVASLGSAGNAVPYLLPAPLLVARSFEEARSKRPHAELRYEFVDSPLLGLEEWREPQQYDVVTCMFAIHYFFVSEPALKQVRWVPEL